MAKWDWCPKRCEKGEDSLMEHGTCVKGGTEDGTAV